MTHIGNHPEITLARPDDAPDIAPFMAHVFAHTYGSAVPQPTLTQYLNDTFNPTEVKNLLQQPNRFSHLARVNGHVVGVNQMCYGVSPPKSQTVPPHNAIEIERFYVSPSHHSKGLAAQLLAAAIALARAKTIPLIWLCVWEHNQRAIAFYRKHGFLVTGHTSVWVNDIHFHDFVMSKNLEI